MANLCSLALSSLLLLHSLAPSNSRTFPINVWPKPQNASWPVPKATTFSPRFRILAPLPLRSAADRCSRRIFSERYHPVVPPPANLTPSESLGSLTILVADLSCVLQHGVDESYALSVSNGRADLTAQTVWGAMHGLETFSQLSWGDPPLVATGVFVYDRPNFAHRGIALDTSRNFYPRKDVLRTIDAMAMNKLNVFHWHVTDSQSFPIVLPSEPELAEEGAYGEGMRYEVRDVKEIVEYGLSRGVRVMPEIDAPGEPP